ncbi:DNA replication protein DnaC [Buttiauxella sp. A111]|nr:DNA replication protein DnaC [Buttiauxella sp. A111]
MPAHVQPKFQSAAELMAWHQEQSDLESARIRRDNEQTKVRGVLGRSGICKLHRKCTFSNYHVGNVEQQRALSHAKSYAQWFGNGFASFVFSGNPGTGKNHLAAAIGNELMAKGKTVLVVTVPDLMLRVRACYDSGKSESDLLDGLCAVDLLVLDEVGVQRETKSEFVLLNQIIDRRLSSMRPVGILTNLNSNQMADLLGARVMDRLTMDNGMWVAFTWGSYRSNVKSFEGGSF